MATSTSTLLEVCNRILLNTNERPLANTTSLIGQQLKECVRQSLHVMSRVGEWSWLQGKINASAWSTHTATLPTTTQRVRNVSWDNGDGVLIPIKYLARFQFDQYQISDYSDATGRPRFYTGLDQINYQFNPYPTGATEQNKIWFYTNSTLSLPGSDSTTFAMPEDFTNILILGATAMFIKRHSEDLGLSRSFEDEFMLELSQAKARQTIQPQNAFNLYRGRGISSYDTV